jgi:hypothetical protein
MDKSEYSKGKAGENFDVSYISLIKGANTILDTLASVWKYSLTALLLSLSTVGVISIAIFFMMPGREVFLTEGVVFLAIAAWISARNFALNCNQCCTADIPHWKAILASFVKPDNTIDTQRDGQSVVESLIQVTVATGDWIRLIKRDIFSVLFWPIVAVLVFVFSVYQVDAFTLRIIAAAFFVYIGALVVVVYFGVNVKFKKWQIKVAQFKSYTATAMENL